MNNINDEWMQYLSTQETGHISQILSQENRKIQSVYKRNNKPNDEIKEISTNEISIVPKCEELYISTTTKVLFLNQEIDINSIFWKIPIIEYGNPCSGIVKKQIKIVSKTPEEYTNQPMLKNVDQNMYNTNTYDDNNVGILKLLLSEGKLLSVLFFI